MWHVLIRRTSVGICHCSFRDKLEASFKFQQGETACRERNLSQVALKVILLLGILGANSRIFKTEFWYCSLLSAFGGSTPSPRACYANFQCAFLWDL